LDRIFATYPKTRIMACGEDVGLPDGQMGNSEVGHLNIGAGRIVYQELTNISKAIEDGRLKSNAALNTAMDHVIANGSALHLFGLVSDGGVHSHIDHLFGIIDMAKEKGVEKLFVHCFLDGRDVPPRCAVTYIKSLDEYMKEKGLGKIATVSGRYYAMDRDNRWERIQKAYDAITLGVGETAESGVEAVENAYKRDENDEFVLPTVVMENGKPVATANDGDSIIMFNFRPDRAREITRACVSDEGDFDRFERKKIIGDLCYVCMTQYDADMPNVLVAFPPEHIKNTLGEYLSSLGLKQLRIAETEKYAHVTFFFNGGVEEPNENEDRILIPSPKVPTYDMQPEMSAYLVTDKVIEMIESDKYDVIILNFANADMVGHTGIMEAAMKAIEALDKCVPRIADAVLAKDGTILMTADHGNADDMIDADGNAVTAHSLNPVPLVNIANKPHKLKDGGRLADLAPTLLDLMDIPAPEEMTGRSLLEK
ncbi:MAG: 2,3-bisphosphoglycerate-independent phosphoglycerate mutase, partial [Firmicutes bacterium]|nr:2,3-bisphosphoglycerate-independent phosphoglycerate mutase [Bacillota bacterium]